MDSAYYPYRRRSGRRNAASLRSATSYGRLVQIISAPKPLHRLPAVTPARRNSRATPLYVPARCPVCAGLGQLSVVPLHYAALKPRPAVHPSRASVRTRLRSASAQRRRDRYHTFRMLVSGAKCAGNWAFQRVHFVSCANSFRWEIHEVRATRKNAPLSAF